MKHTRTHELLKRLLVTIAILALYLIGRNILIYKIDVSAYHLDEIDQQNLLYSYLTGDRYKYTIFSLGIMPYITSSLIISTFLTLKGKDYRARISPQKQDRITLISTLLLSTFLAISQSNELVFLKCDIEPLYLKIIATVEMIVGTMVVYEMSDINKEYGLCGQTPIMLVNIIDSLYKTISNYPVDTLLKLLPYCVIIALIVLVINNATIKIPVQRVSIHNDFADKSYIEFKASPVGTMPVMFAVSLFSLPQAIISLLSYFYKDSKVLASISDKFTLNHIVGVIVYLYIIFLLTIVLAFVMLAPQDIADQLQKSGDSIVGVYAGTKTRKYLNGKLLGLCIFSGVVTSVIMGVSLIASMEGNISPELALFPSTIMLLLGNITTIYTEIKTYRQYDSYNFFI